MGGGGGGRANIQKDRHTNKHRDIATYRLNLLRGPVSEKNSNFAILFVVVSL